MNLSEARTELGDRGFDYLDASRMNLMLNDALQDFEDFYPWPWLHKTVTGATPLEIADLKAVLKVYDSNGNELLGLGDADPFSTADTGTPTNWWIDDTSGTPTLVAYPVGDATLSVRYLGDSSELVDSGDTPNIPERYARTWIDLAVARAYEDSDNFAAASAIRNTAVQRMMALVQRYENRDMQSPPQRLVRSWSLDD